MGILYYAKLFLLSTAAIFVYFGSRYALGFKEKVIDDMRDPSRSPARKLVEAALWVLLAFGSFVVLSLWKGPFEFLL